jgi:hypothetical protein
VSKVVLAQPRFNPGSVWARVASFLSLGRMGPRRPDVGLLDLSAPLHAKILEQLDLHSALAVSATCRELHGCVLSRSLARSGVEGLGERRRHSGRDDNIHTSSVHHQTHQKLKIDTVVICTRAVITSRSTNESREHMWMGRSLYA